MSKIIINGSKFELEEKVSDLILLISKERDALRSLVESHSFNVIPQSGGEGNIVANQYYIRHL
jgi:hypothetical protein